MTDTSTTRDLKQKTTICFVILCGGFLGGLIKRYGYLVNYFSDRYPDNYNTLLLTTPRITSWLQKNGIHISDNCKVVYYPSEIERDPVDEQLDRSGNQGRSADNPGRSWILTTALLPFKFFRRYIRLVRKWRFDASVFEKYNVTHLIGVYWGGESLIPYKHSKKIHTIFPFVDNNFFYISNGWLSPNPSFRNVLTTAQKVDFLQPALKERLEMKGLAIPRPRSFFSPNSFVDFSVYRRYEEIVKEEIIVFASRIEPIKKPELFVDAVSLLYKNHPQLKVGVLMFGMGEQELVIREKIDQLVLNDRIHFMGETDNLMEYLFRSKVFVRLDEVEIYPSQVVIEAMFAGNAIIASNVGEAFRMVEDGKNGYLVENSAEAIAGRMADLMTTPDSFSDMGKLSKTKAETEFSIDNFARYYIQLFNS